MKKIIWGIIAVAAILIVLFGSNFYLLRMTVPDWKENSLLQKFAKQYCVWRDGSMIVSGSGIGGGTYQCAKIYKDGGKACENSEQCSGFCITKDERLPDTSFDIVFLTEKMEYQCSKDYNYRYCENLKHEMELIRILESCTKTSEKTYEKRYHCPDLNLKGICEIQKMSNCETNWELNNNTISTIAADCSI